MAIIPEATHIPAPENPTEMKYMFTNGDFQALQEVINKYNFKDAESALRFALFLLLKSEDNGVWVTEGGRPIRYVPDKSSLK